MTKIRVELRTVLRVRSRDGHRNWALRIRKLQRRLLEASTIATSVDNRVPILDAVILPSILFTAAMFEISDWARKDAQNLYI